MSLALGMLTLISILFSVLALMDIYEGTEPNLDMEWNMLRLTFLIVLVFTSISMITIFKFSKNKRKKE